MHPVETVQRTFPVTLVVAYLRYAGSRLFLIGVGIHLRQDDILRQRFGGLTQTVIRIRQIIPRYGAIPSSGAVLGDIIAEADGRFLVRSLHILHLGRGIEKRILCGRHIHIHLRQGLGVGEVFIYIAALHIQRLECIERRVGLFRSRIALYRLAVRSDSLVVLIEIAEEHRPLQTRFARQRGVRISVQQLLIRSDSAPLVVLLQLRTGDLIYAVVRIVGFRVALHEIIQHADLLAVFMLQAEGITLLEERIVRSCRLQVRYLRIIRDSLRELAGVEIAITDAVERICVGRLRSQRCINIRDERIARFVILLLREIGVALQIAGDRVVRRSLGTRTAEEGIQVLLAGGIVAQTVVCLRTHIIRLRGVFGALRVMLDHLRHPFCRLLHLTLQEMIRA